MSAREPEEVGLESALERLEGIAERLEGNEIELAEALALYEEGVRLVRLAEGVLGAVETRMEQLRPDGGGWRLGAAEEGE